MASVSASGGDTAVAQTTIEQIEATNVEQIEPTTVEQILEMRSLSATSRKRQADVRRQLDCRGRINQAFVDWMKLSLDKDDIRGTLRRMYPSLSSLASGNSRARSRSPKDLAVRVRHLEAALEKAVGDTKVILALDGVKKQWHRHEVAARMSNLEKQIANLKSESLTKDNGKDKEDDMGQNQSMRVIVKRWHKSSPTRLVFMDQSQSMRVRAKRWHKNSSSS